MTPPPPSSPPSSKPKQKSRVHTLSVGERQLFVRGLAAPSFHDIYYWCMTMTWPWFYGAVAALFGLINLVFATLYWLQPGCIANMAPADFWGAFFFSVETLATVGYGDMHPATVYAHVVATMEIFIGMMSIALITGLTFARFSRPRARIMASRHPVINTYNGQSVLMIRAANARKSMIVQANAQLYVLMAEESPEGHKLRRLLDLKLLREVHPMFFLSWTLIHVIDEHSPLWGHDADSLLDAGASLVLTIEGHDEVTMQDLRSRHLYKAQDIRWNHVFQDMLTIDATGREIVDYERLHDTKAVE